MTHDTFDLIVIGAGSAGCLLANRLAANQNNTVCLIEAGGEDNHLNIRAPGGFVKLFKTQFDWAYETEPEPP